MHVSVVFRLARASACDGGGARGRAGGGIAGGGHDRDCGRSREAGGFGQRTGGRERGGGRSGTGGTATARGFGSRSRIADRDPVVGSAAERQWRYVGWMRL